MCTLRATSTYPPPTTFQQNPNSKNYPRTNVLICSAQFFHSENLRATYTHFYIRSQHLPHTLTQFSASTLTLSRVLRARQYRHELIRIPSRLWRQKEETTTTASWGNIIPQHFPPPAVPRSISWEWTSGWRRNGHNDRANEYGVTCKTLISDRAYPYDRTRSWWLRLLLFSWHIFGLLFSSVLSTYVKKERKKYRIATATSPGNFTVSVDERKEPHIPPLACIIAGPDHQWYHITSYHAMPFFFFLLHFIFAETKPCTVPLTN